MSDVVFTAETRTADASLKSGCIGGLSLTLGVVAVVSAGFLISGQSMTDSLRLTVIVATPLGFVLGGGLGWWAWRIHRQAARTLTLTRTDSGFELRIEPDVRCEGAFQAECGWQKMSIKPGVSTKLLWCDLSLDGELLIRLTHEIGALYSPPEGWAQRDAPMTSPARHGGYSLKQVAEFVDALG